MTDISREKGHASADESGVGLDLVRVRSLVDEYVRERDEASADAERQKAGMREVALFRAANYQGLLGGLAVPLLAECERLTALLHRIATARRGDCGGQEWDDFDRLPKEIEDMWRQITDAIDCRSIPQ